MQVESIAKVCNTLDRHSATICHLDICAVFFLVAVLHRFECVQSL